MNLLFIHTGIKLKKDNEGNLYINGEYSRGVLQRYMDLADELTVIFQIEDKVYDKSLAEKGFEKFDDKNIRLIEYINTRKSIRDFISIKNRLKNKMIIKSAIQDSDKVIIRLPSSSGISVAKYAKKYNKKCFGEVVGCAWDSMWNYGIKGKILAPLSFIYTKRTIKKMDYVLYVTNEFLQKRYPNKNHILGCSDVEINESGKEILEKRINKIEKMNDCKHLSIGTIGAVDVIYKGQEYVIRAISILKEEGYDIKYYLIGSGDNKFLKELAILYGVEKNVIFVGALPHNQIFEYLDLLDLYIQPSNTEGLCRSIIEAMNRACPVIVSNVGGNPELITNREYIFKKRKYKQIVEIIKNLNKDKLNEMAKINYNNSLQYTKDKLESKRREFYKKYISEN